MDPSRRRTLALAAGLVAAGAGGVVAGAGRFGLAGLPWSTGPRRVVPVAAGPRRSDYLAWAEALAEQVRLQYPGLDLDARTSAGSVDNVRRLAGGEVTLAVASTDVAGLALRGTAPFTVPVPVRALARVYDDYVHLIVRDDSGFDALADLRGRRVAVGPDGSGTALVAQRLLAAARIRVRAVDLDVVEAGLALQGRRIDALFWLGGLPTRAVTELAERVRVRLLPLGAQATRLRALHGAAYRRAAVPGGTYARPEPVVTVASANLLLGRADTPGDVVSAVLRTAFDRRDAIAAAQANANALDDRVAIATQPVPLHPAAVAYYRDRKP